MTRLSPEAARLKYEYNRKYMDRYWEKKAAEKRAGSQPQRGSAEAVSVSRMGKTDERYITALEESNKTLNRENRRLVKLLNYYQSLISQSSLSAQS